MNRIFSFAAFAIPLALYLETIQRFPRGWDTGEFQTAAYILGIPHATGFPAFVLIGWLFAHGLPFGSVAFRVNAMCVLAAAGTAWNGFRVMRRLGAENVSALSGACLFAFGNAVWAHGTRAEVHTLALFFITLSLAFWLQWSDDRHARTFVFALASWGVALAVHTVAVWLAPGIALIVAARYRTLSAKTVFAGVGLFALALSAYAYLPIRSAVVYRERLDPTLTLGLPPGGQIWDNDHPAEWNGFLTLVLGREFDKRDAFAAPFSVTRYPEFAQRWFKYASYSVPLLALALALVGFAALLRRERLAAFVLLLSGALPALFGLGYGAEGDVDRYLLLSYWIVAVTASVGVQTLSDFVQRYVPPLNLPFAYAPFVIWFTLGNHNNFAWQRDDRGAESLIDNVVANTPDDAILVAPWNEGTALAYGAYVEQRLGKRIVDIAGIDTQAALAMKWLRTRPVYTFEVRKDFTFAGIRLEKSGTFEPQMLRVRLAPALEIRAPKIAPVPQAPNAETDRVRAEHRGPGRKVDARREQH